MLKEEFKKLHQFLKKEEEGRIAALNREVKEKRGRIDSIIQGRIQSLSDMIREVEEEIKDNDIDFLEVRDEYTKFTVAVVFTLWCLLTMLVTHVYPSCFVFLQNYTSMMSRYF